jgi:prepilin-type N-terminal cleavage/methylation domain-containing protein
MSPKTLTRKQTQHGFALLELTVAIILVSLLAAASIFGYQANQRRTEVRDNTTLVIETAAELQKKFGINGQYGAITTAIAVQSRAIPANLRIAGTTTAQNSYGGMITAAPVTLTTTDDSVALTWANVPQSQCIDLVQTAHQTARRVRVAGTAVKAIDTALPVVATLATQCESADRVDVIFDIGRTSTS